MIGLLAQAATTTDKPESLVDALGPIVAICSLLYAGWTKIRAARLSSMLRAVAVGVKAYMDALPEAAQEEALKAKIEAAAGGKGADLNLALKAEVRKATSGAIKIPDGLLGGGNGNPFPDRPAALLLALLLPIVLAAGCVSAAVHDASVTARVAAAHLRDTSQPSAAWLTQYTGMPDGAGGKWTEARLIEVWAREWAALEGAQESIERGTR